MLSLSNLVTILAALLPAIITVIGGQAILIRYRRSKIHVFNYLNVAGKWQR